MQTLKEVTLKVNLALVCSSSSLNTVDFSSINLNYSTNCILRLYKVCLIIRDTIIYTTYSYIDTKSILMVRRVGCRIVCLHIYLYILIKLYILTLSLHNFVCGYLNLSLCLLSCLCI